MHKKIKKNNIYTHQIYNQVDFTLLYEKEWNYKVCTDLFTIFYLTKNVGLTDVEICNIARHYKLTGYDGLTPDCIVRSKIYRWNDISDSIFNVQCLSCKKFARYGYEWGKPLYCTQHSIKNMYIVIEQRLYRAKKEFGSSKGKYYLDKNFLNRILQDNNFLSCEYIQQVPILYIKTKSKEKSSESVYLKINNNENVQETTTILSVQDFLDSIWN